VQKKIRRQWGASTGKNKTTNVSAKGEKWRVRQSRFVLQNSGYFRAVFAACDFGRKSRQWKKTAGLEGKGVLHGLQRWRCGKGCGPNSYKPPKISEAQRKTGEVTNGKRSSAPSPEDNEKEQKDIVPPERHCARRRPRHQSKNRGRMLSKKERGGGAEMRKRRDRGSSITLLKNQELGTLSSRLAREGGGGGGWGGGGGGGGGGGWGGGGGGSNRQNSKNQIGSKSS